MARSIDPIRRVLPLAEWPPQDRAAWTSAIADADVFEDGGGATHWAERTKMTNLGHYGRWLGYLRYCGCLDESSAPAERVTRERIGSYLRHLEPMVAPVTRLSMLVGLTVMMKAMAPDRNWDWLQRVCNRIRATAKPVADKRSRMQSTPRIFAAAIKELESLSSNGLTMNQAIAYRDALMLALLASRPLRTKNFTMLELGRHVVPVDGNWLLVIPAEETKNSQPLAFLLPAPLLPWFDRYLVSVRPQFSEAECSRRVWLGKDGPLRGKIAVWSRITKLTRRLFGHAINPHLLRDCAASSLATASGELARAAAPLLGHRCFSTTERYYIQANNLEASRKLNLILRKTRTN